MKKSLIGIALLITFCITNIASAAKTPTDLPANHWAYSAVKKLAEEGIIEGYSDGNFAGDKIMTRYEMAQIVEKAVANSTKATAQQKYLIDKLGIEFALELNKIDTRVRELEKTQSSLKIDGLLQYRYEYIKNPRVLAEDVGLSSAAPAGHASDKSASRTLFLLNLSNRFDGDTYFHGILASETLGGRTTTADLSLREGNVNKKFGDSVELGVGRFIPDLGFGTIGGAPYMDGVKLSFGKKTKVNFYSARLGDYYGYPNRTYNLGDVKCNLNSNLAMSLAFNVDKNKEMYNSAAVGLAYKGIPNIVLDGEYGKNDSTFAKGANNGSSARAYFIRMKYKGANPFVVGSSGLSIQYKHADAAFDPLAFADPFAWNAPLNYTSLAMGGIAENLKGFEYRFESTVAKRTIFSMSYDDLKRVRNASGYSLATANDQSFFTAQVTYLF